MSKTLITVLSARKSDQKCYFTAGDTAKKVYANAWKQGQEHQPMQKSRSKVEPEMLYIFLQVLHRGSMSQTSG